MCWQGHALLSHSGFTINICEMMFLPISPSMIAQGFDDKPGNNIMFFGYHVLN